jgi:hypothetical protein
MLNEGTVMRRWIVQDREGREIYLTEERWQHIRFRHKPLADQLDDVLATIRAGRRKQDPLQPFKYFYQRRCNTLPGAYNTIIVVVLYDADSRYVVTAWPSIE